MNSANYIWVSLTYTVSLSVSLVLVGRITDIFGRRWFTISFTLLGVIGTIVCATAQSIPILIGGNVLLGVSTACGMSFPFLIGELVSRLPTLVLPSLANQYHLNTGTDPISLVRTLIGCRLLLPRAAAPVFLPLLIHTR